ncbi:MAG: glycosyltransferase, partial [Planctomycetota bacterium]
MRILLVSHRFPPDHRAGTELYGARLAAGLRERGHEVRVICAEKEISAVDRSVRQREHDGVQVTEIVNNLQYESFRETWDSPEIAARFDEVLAGFLSEGWRPDVCHFQHFMYLGVGCIEACAKRSLPVLLTLHDYWLQCARMGQRRHADETLCDTLDARRCGGCLVDFKWRQTPLEARVGTAIAKLRQVIGVDLGPLATGAARRTSAAQVKLRGTELIEELPEARELTREVELREAELRSRLRKAVSLFTSPSAFLKERFVEWGIGNEEILHLPTGIDFTAPAGER